VYRIKKLKKGPKFKGLYSHRERESESVISRKIITNYISFNAILA
jgi:hypothetical protein